MGTHTPNDSGRSKYETVRKYKKHMTIVGGPTSHSEFFLIFDFLKVGIYH